MLSEDVSTYLEERIPDIRSLLTLLDGEIIFQPRPDRARNRPVHVSSTGGATYRPTGSGCAGSASPGIPAQLPEG